MPECFVRHTVKQSVGKGAVVDIAVSAFASHEIAPYITLKF